MLHDDTFDLFCKQKESKNKGECMGKMMDSVIKLIKKPGLCCSVVKHLGNSDNTQEVGRNTCLWLVFPPALLSCYCRFLHALQQNRSQSRLLYLLIQVMQ